MQKEPSRRRQTAVLVAYGVVPLALWVALAWGLGTVDRGIALLARYRPPRTAVDQATFQESQLAGVDAARRSGQAAGSVVFLGSSSVVNGIDPTVVEERWSAAGLTVEARNHGLRVFHAYELPLVDEFLVPEGAVGAVYLYSVFSFVDEPHPDVVTSRWDTREFVSLYGWRHRDPEDVDRVVTAVAGELLPLVRYRNLVGAELVRWARGEAELLTWPYDYAPGEPVPGWRIDSVPEPPVPIADFSRLSVVQSQQSARTMGDIGLERFLELSARRGLPVALGPVPEPTFQRFRGYWVDTDRTRVDDRVRRVARRHGLEFIERQEIAWLERYDPYFQDDVHLHELGRAVYSVWLAARLEDWVRREVDPRPSR